MSNKWINQSSRPRLASKAFDALRALQHERYKHTEIIGNGHEATVAKLGVGHEDISNVKAVTLFHEIGDRHNWTLTNENVKAVTTEAQGALIVAQEATEVIDRRTANAIAKGDQ